MDQPLIGITSSFMPANESRGESVQLNASYFRAVQQTGALPLLIPPQANAASIDGWLDRVDGLVLTGGGDVDPARYGEQPAGTMMASVSVERDTVEIAAATGALLRGVPILAICRGMQVLNVALGGSLIQDIPTAVGETIEHAQTRPTTGRDPAARDAPTHWIGIAPGSRVRSLCGRDSLQTNSMHHQAVKALGGGLIAVAWTEDGVVEALELPGDRFVVGVQWHPEELVVWSKEARALFEGLYAATRAGVSV